MKKIILSLCICVSSFYAGLLAASNISEATVHSEKIILGSGCFWGAEKGYESLPGVIDAVSGYADGKGVRASYGEITKLKNKFNNNNHAEVVEVTYNKNVISTEELLMHYFESHDPTQVNRQSMILAPNTDLLFCIQHKSRRKLLIRCLMLIRIF